MTAEEERTEGLIGALGLLMMILSIPLIIMAWIWPQGFGGLITPFEGFLGMFVPALGLVGMALIIHRRIHSGKEGDEATSVAPSRATASGPSPSEFWRKQK